MQLARPASRVNYVSHKCHGCEDVSVYKAVKIDKEINIRVIIKNIKNILHSYNLFIITTKSSTAMIFNFFSSNYEAF